MRKTTEDSTVAGNLSIGHLSNSSVKSAKVAIKIIIISSYFGKNLWCTFTEMLDKKKNTFNIFIINIKLGYK